MYRYVLYRNGRDPDEAADVTQEVFVQAIQCIDSFRGDPSALARWMRGIARRILAGRGRKLRPAAARPLSLDGRIDGTGAGGPWDPADTRPRIDQTLAVQDECVMTGTALTSLPERWESALRWKYCEDLSVAQIAERLNVTPKAAESLLGRARAGFRRVYRKIAENNSHALIAKESRNERTKR